MLLSPSPLRCMAKSSFTAQGIPREKIQPPPRLWVVYSDSRQVSQILSQDSEKLGATVSILACLKAYTRLAVTPFRFAQHFHSDSKR
jgi:hypothetical protein